MTGTSDRMTAGNTYVIEGTYRLASLRRATLLASVTAVNPDRPWEGINVPEQPLQQVELDQGAGRFKLRLSMAYEGQPHVSFYPAEGGESFANAYFGTGESVCQRGWWETVGKGYQDARRPGRWPILCALIPGRLIRRRRVFGVASNRSTAA